MKATRLCSPHCCIPPHSRPVPPAALPQMLNAAGYGRPGSGLMLDLVYNPGGVFLAPPQSTLEPVYKQVEAGQHWVVRWVGDGGWQAAGGHPRLLMQAPHGLLWPPAARPRLPCLPACPAPGPPAGAGGALWHLLQLPALPQQHAHQALGRPLGTGVSRTLAPAWQGAGGRDAWNALGLGLGWAG